MQNKIIKRFKYWILPIIVLSIIVVPTILMAADFSGLTARKSLKNPASDALNTLGETSQQLILSSDATTPPEPPTNVAATENLSDKVTITWTKSSGATDYHVYRGATDLGSAGDVDTFDDTGAAAPTITINSSSVGQGVSTANVPLSVTATGNDGTSYTYYVVASNGAGSSAASDGDVGYRKIGALGYQWYRSSGTSDADFSTLGGATTASYNDATASAPTITAGNSNATDGIYNVVRLTLSGTSANVGAAKYYYCAVSATDVTTQNSTHYSGYRGVGSLTYQWQRSLADSDANYNNITGATTATYDDSQPPDLAGRYYKCVLNATGATEQTSSADRGYLDTSKPSPSDNSNASKNLLFLLIPIELAAIVIIIMVMRMQSAGSVKALAFTLSIAIFLIVTFLIVLNFLNVVRG